jgi:hypothetical protein
MGSKGVGTDEPKVVEAVQGLVSENLDRVEAQLDSTVESAKEAVHELRSEAQEVADKTVTAFQGPLGPDAGQGRRSNESAPVAHLGKPLSPCFRLQSLPGIKTKSLKIHTGGGHGEDGSLKLKG